MADHDGSRQPKGIPDIKRVQGEIQHVAQMIGTFRILIARQQRCIHVIVLG